MVDPSVIGFDHIKYLFDSGNCEIVNLWYPIDYATARALHTTSNVDYVVPSGKKAILVLADQASIGGDSATYIWNGTSADSSSGTQVYYGFMGEFNAPLHLFIDNFPAGDYINVQNDGYFNAIVIEVDA